MNIIILGFLGSLAAGLMTALGATPVLLGRRVSATASDALLGFAAGVMLSASYFSLILPSLEISEHLFGPGVIPALIAAAGIVIGATTLAGLDAALPRRRVVADHDGLRRIWLFVTALALRSEGYDKRYAFAIAALTGLVEPLAGTAGAAAVGVSHLVLPWGLTFAAGAMIYVIAHEIIPRAHRHGPNRGATAGLILGAVVMLCLDVAFG